MHADGGGKKESARFCVCLRKSIARRDETRRDERASRAKPCAETLTSGRRCNFFFQQCPLPSPRKPLRWAEWKKKEFDPQLRCDDGACARFDSQCSPCLPWQNNDDDWPSGIIIDGGGGREGGKEGGRFDCCYLDAAYCIASDGVCL